MNKKPFVLTLLLLFSVLALFAQTPGFYIYDEEADSVIALISDNDTVNLTTFYQNPGYNLKYMPGTATVSNPLYSFEFERKRYYAYDQGEQSYYTSSGSRYYYDQSTSYSYLGDYDLTVTGLDYDSLFIDGPLLEGQYSFWFGSGEGFQSIILYDSVKFFMYWDGGKQKPIYYLMDPIEQSPIVQINYGDTLNNVIGDISALVWTKAPGPQDLKLVDLQIQYDDFHTFPDTLSFLKADALVYSTGRYEDNPLFLLPGYSGSGKYYIRNRANLLDTGIVVHVTRPVGADTVILDTIYNTVNLDSIIWTYIPKDSIVWTYIPKDTTVYNYIQEDTTIYNIILQDSIVWNLVTQDSIIWNLVTQDSIQWEITIQDSIIWNTILQDSIQWTIIQKDSVEYNLILKDSTVFTIINKDSIQYNLILQDSIVWNLIPTDSIVWNLVPKDSIVWTLVYQDSIEWNIVQKDSINWTFINKDSTVLNIIYSDSVVYDTMGIDTYTELILPVLLNELAQISGDAQNMRNLLIKIRDEGLREKEIYPEGN